MCLAAAQHTVTARVVLFKVGERAARGHVQQFHSVCTDPIGLAIPSDGRCDLVGTTGLSQAVGHRVYRGK